MKSTPDKGRLANLQNGGVPSRLHAAVTCGLGGFVSGLIAVFSFSYLAPPHLEDHFFLVRVLFAIPGISLLLALIGCWMTMHGDVSLRPISPRRAASAACLIGLNSFLSLEIAFAAGLVAAMLNRLPPDWKQTTPSADSYFFYALPLITGLIVGGLAAATILANALHQFTGTWSRNGWVAFLSSSVAVVVAVLFIDPRFLLVLKLANQPGEKLIVTLGFLTIFILGNTLYGASAGLWLAESHS